MLLQDETSECGLVCLAVVSEQLGSCVDLPTLRRKYLISSRGLTMREVKDISVDMGMVGRAISCDVDELRNLKTPSILHWGFNHFVVLKKVSRHKFTIYDPVLGVIHPAKKDVENHFTGVALELAPGANFVKRRVSSELDMSSWLRLSKEMYSPLAQILVLSITIQIYAIATPFFLQLAIDQAAAKSDLNVLNVLAWGFGGFCVFNSGATFLRGFAAAKLTSLLNWDMTVRLFRHMLRLPLPWFQRRKLADALSRFDSIGPLRDLMSGALVSSVIDGLLAICTLGMMFAFSMKLSIVVIASFLTFIVIRFCTIPITLKLGSALMMSKIAEVGIRIETIRAIQTLKVMGAENDRENDWANKFAENLNKEQRLNIANLSFSTAQSLAEGLTRVLLIYIGVTEILNKEMSIGVFYAFLSYQSQFSVNSSALFDQIIKWRNSSIYNSRLADIVLTQKEPSIDLPASSQPPIDGEIELRNLGFSYSAYERMIFANINVKIGKGEFVAIVGSSGVGKSTLLKVICGLYPCTVGDVLYDRRSISTWGPKAIRSGLGVVMQDDELLSGTIAENVAFFDTSIDIRWVWECLELAAVASDIRLMPLRAETVIGDMGTTLSGGQKQRILLARALYRRPKILLLDEATSHVDVTRESIINKTLKSLNMTRVIVAHRPETIAAADRVICMENGSVVSDVKKSTLIF